MNNKNVLLIGAGGGIASSFIKSLEKRGAKVVKTRSSASQSADVVMDLSDPHASIENAKQLGDQKFDMVIINAGVVSIAPYGEKKPEDIIKEYTINLTAPAALLAALIHNLNQDAVIVLNSSLNAYFYTPYTSTYCSAKSGLLALGEALRHEHENKGIRVVTLLTPPINTGMAKEASANLNKYAKNDAPQKLVDPDEFSEWMFAKVEAGQNGILVHPSIKHMVLLNRLFPHMQSGIYRKMFK